MGLKCLRTLALASFLALPGCGDPVTWGLVAGGVGTAAATYMNTRHPLPPERQAVLPPHFGVTLGPETDWSDELARLIGLMILGGVGTLMGARRKA